MRERQYVKEISGEIKKKRRDIKSNGESNR